MAGGHGENPARLKGRSTGRNVSWDNCREFIDKINGLKPGLELRLPTEANGNMPAAPGLKPLSGLQ